MPIRSYDPKCYELAKHFLWDTPLDDPQFRRELALRIQETVEEFIQENTDA